MMASRETWVAIATLMILSPSRLRRGSTRKVGRSLQAGHEGRDDLVGSIAGWSTTLGLAGHGSDEIGHDGEGSSKRGKIGNIMG
jgi:hypothetical protein